jgi:hypothetical protein
MSILKKSQHLILKVRNETNSPRSLHSSSRERIELNPQSVGISLELLVLLRQVPLHDSSDADPQAREDDLQDHSHGVTRLVAVGEEVRRPDVAEMAENVHHRSGGSTLLGCLAESGYRPSVLQRIGRETTCGVQEGHGVAGGCISCGDGDDEADDGAAEGDDDVQTSLTSAVRVPRDVECACRAQDVGRSCHEQRGNAVAETQTTDDSREKVVEPVRARDEDVEAKEAVKLDVLESEHETMPDSTFGRTLNTVVKNASMGDQTHLCSHVPHCAAGSRSRVVGQYEEGGNSEEGAHSTLEDEEPLPAGEAHGTIETAEDAGGNQAGESLGEYET